METITLTNAFTDDNRYNPCTRIVVGTSLDLERTISGTPSNISSLSLWFKREADVIIQLGTANDCLRIAADGTLALVANGTSSSNFQNATLSDTIATAGEWHHLAWVKKDDEHTLYLNGIICDSQTLAEEALNPATIDKITAETATAYVVHMHGYDRALEATEVVVDKMSQYNATKSFTDQYPLNFTLKDLSTEGAPEMSDDKLIIEDITAKEHTYQRLVITNVADETLRFVPKTSAVSKENYHLEVRFRNGTFVSPSEYPKFDDFETDNLLAGEPSGIPADWQATAPLQHSQDGSWSVYLLRTTALDVASNDTLEFPFEYTTADGSLGGRSTRVTLGYKQITYADDAQAVAGIREKQIDIINNSSNNAHVSALNKKVTAADAKVDQLEKDVENSIGTLEDLLTTSDTKKAEIDSAKEAAVTAQEAANKAKVAAEKEKGEAETAKTAAETARQNAQDAETNAIREKEEAVQAKTAAETARQNAQDAETAAREAAKNAIDGTTEQKKAAEQAKTAAETARQNAQDAETNAIREKEDAVQAKTDAETARQNAQDAETNAIREKEEAVQAKTAAETAQNAAEKAKQDLLDAASGTNGQIGLSDGENRSGSRVLEPSIISNGTLGEFFTGVINTFKTLSANIKAVDDEVDLRAAASDYIENQLETSFPLIASVSGLHNNQPTAGIVIGATGAEKSKLKFTLNNVGLQPVTFTDNAEFRFIIPMGTGADKLVQTSNAAGTMDPQSDDPSAVSDAVVFKWKPSKTINQDKDNVTVNGTTGTLSIVGKTISFTLGDDITMANHTPKVSYNQTTGGAAKVATSINNGKLSITITVKRDADTDTWPSVTDLANSLDGLPGISGASGDVKTLEPDTISGSIASRKSKTFTISGITPNPTPGFVTIFIEYQGIVGYPSGKLSVAVSKVSKDIAQLVGGGNVGIGTNDPKKKLHILDGSSTGNAVNANASLIVESDNVNWINVIQPSGKEGGILFSNGADSAHGGIIYLDTGNMQFRTGGNTNRMVIDQTGNVGIGTTHPQAKLEVNGVIKADVTSLNTVGGTHTIQTKSICLQNNSTTDSCYWRRNGSGEYCLQTYNSANTGKLLLQPYGGNVGIGTTSLSEKLHVNGNAVIGESGETLKIGNIGYQGWAGIAHTSRANKNDYALIQNSSGSTILNSKSGQGLHFRQGNSDKMYIDVHGNVIIKSRLYLYNTSGGNGNSNDWLWLQGNQVQRKKASDKRLKKNIDVISEALLKITSLRGVSYEWNEQGLHQKIKNVKEHFISGENTPEADEKLWLEKIKHIREENSGTYKGFIAQELETVFPEWVQEGEEGYKTIETSELTAVLVEAIKELNDKFESALEKLTKKVDVLAKRVK